MNVLLDSRREGKELESLWSVHWALFKRYQVIRCCEALEINRNRFNEEEAEVERSRFSVDLAFLFHSPTPHWPTLPPFLPSTRRKEEKEGKESDQSHHRV